MTVFVDTSALLPILNRDDRDYPKAYKIWQDLAAEQARLITSSYVLVESTALIQNQLGMDAVRIFQEGFVPLLQIVWVNAELHNMGMAALLTADRRGLSLVDCVSFVICQQRHVESVFAFDQHFSEQGVAVLTA